MLNFTLTITAAPELLAAMSTFANAIAGAKVSHLPQTNSEAAAVQVLPTQIPIVPISAPTYTMEQLAVAATQIVDEGRREELVNLLQSFGVKALTALSKEQYGAFAAQLRALGAKIDNPCVQKRN